MKYAHIAKAVMPPVGEWLGRRVMDGICRGALIAEPTVETVDLESRKPKKQIEEELP
jgi:hypothetical protein